VDWSICYQEKDFFAELQKSGRNQKKHILTDVQDQKSRMNVELASIRYVKSNAGYSSQQRLMRDRWRSSVSAANSRTQNKT